MIDLLERHGDIFFKKNLHFVASASTALYIFIKEMGIEGKNILCPSNVCYSIPYTILGTGNYPLFCDVDPLTGNASLINIDTAVKESPIAAILLPHMFGNPVKERAEIQKLCKKNDILLIDDCAGALGMDDIDSGITNDSDAVIFSFNSNKHIPLGAGGVLATNRKIDIERHKRTIKNSRESHRFKIELIDRLYKPIFYSDHYYTLIGKLHTFNDFFADSHIYRFDPEHKYEMTLSKLLGRVEADRGYRKNMNRYIEERIDYDTPLFTKYIFSDGCNPWRFNILINENSERKKIIGKMLELGLPVSIWYPPIDPIFGHTAKPNSTIFSKRILNFDFINASRVQTEQFIDILNEFKTSFQRKRHG
ncbi:DegT/DnrJ/EryC1/StrS family aminotransferase [Hydrogenimonas sp.]